MYLIFFQLCGQEDNDVENENEDDSGSITSELDTYQCKFFLKFFCSLIKRC